MGSVDNSFFHNKQVDSMKCHVCSENMELVSKKFFKVFIHEGNFVSSNDPCIHKQGIESSWLDFKRFLRERKKHSESFPNTINGNTFVRIYS